MTMRPKLKLRGYESSWYVSILFYSLFLFSSCYAQNSVKVSNNVKESQHSFPMSIGDVVTEMNDSIMVVFQDRHNNYWFGSNGAGVYRYDGKTILHFSTKDGLCNNRIWKIVEDKSGNLYFPSQQGCVSKFDGQKFSTLPIASREDSKWALGPDDLWFRNNMESGIVYRYDGTILHGLTLPESKVAEDFISAHPHLAIRNMNFSRYAVYEIYKDTMGMVWFGTGAMGVCRYDGTFFDWISEEDVTELHDGPSNGVRSILEDKEGKFWFSNTMFRYDIYQHNKHERGTPGSQEKNGFSYIREKGIGSLDGREDSGLNEYLSAVKDNNGDIWIATYSAGVWNYNGKKISHYPIMEGNAIVTVFSISKDNHGGLWLGTHAAGPYKFNGKTFEKFRS